MPKYKLPLKDSLVVGHVDPDGDSLSSVKAVLNHLRSNGKTAVAKVIGDVPTHLSWILSEEDLPSEIPIVDQTIVLDCGPTPDRVGFKVEGNVVNIDHHSTRMSEHKPRKKVYVLDRCSTAAALILDFGIIDSILLVGLYTDTLFAKRWGELVECFKKIHIDDETEEDIMTSLRPSSYTKALLALKRAEFHKCRNGFLIVETDEKDAAVVSEIMDISYRYADNVCLVDGNSKARLRSSNKNLINSKKISGIASILGGGGHDFAAGADVTGKKTALFAVIKQLIIPEDKHHTEGKDGYEHDKK